MSGGMKVKSALPDPSRPDRRCATCGHMHMDHAVVDQEGLEIDRVDTCYQCRASRGVCRAFRLASDVAKAGAT